MSLAFPQSRATTIVRSGGKLVSVLVAALAAFACNGNPPPKPPANTPVASNTNAGVAAARIKGDPVNDGVKFPSTSGVTFTKGLVIVEADIPAADLPAGATISCEVVIKRDSQVEHTESVGTFASGKHVIVTPLTSAMLGKVTEITWRETGDASQFKFKFHKTLVFDKIKDDAFAAMSFVSKDEEFDCCPKDLGTRGMFTTPIGVRLYLQP